MRTVGAKDGPALREDVLYSGDNGRIFCGALRCAGTSAHFDGITLAGWPVERLTVAEAREGWTDGNGKHHDFTCEGCGKGY